MNARSRRHRIPSSRALVCDVLHFGRNVPTFVHSRRLLLADVARLRANSPRRISWSILFAKAYGLLALELPVLRQTWMRWPWPHLYEHPLSVATIALSRKYAGEDRLCWLRLKRPETYSLVELQQSLERHQQEPVEVAFRRQLQLSRLPAAVRRLAWRFTMISGPKRALRLGTFAMTTLAAEGIEIDLPPSIHTSTLTFGPLDAHGQLRAAIAYDHRIMDGITVARCLVRLEEILQGPIAAELRQMGIQSADEMSARRRAS